MTAIIIVAIVCVTVIMLEFIAQQAKRERYMDILTKFMEEYNAASKEQDTNIS